MCVNLNQLNIFSLQKHEAPPFVLLWCKLELVRSCTLLQLSLLTISKVMSGRVTTYDLTGFNCANSHQAVLCFLQIGMKMLTFFKSRNGELK
jgi:hypothetical protein